MIGGRTSPGKAPVLILGASPRVAVPIARCLAKIGVNCDVATFVAAEPRISSRYIAGFHRLPAKEDPGFAEALCSLIRRRGFDMLIPTSDAPLRAMAQHYDQLKPLLYPACPPPPVVERVLNKAETLRIAEQCGIGVPKTRVIENAEQAPSMVAGMRFPLVVKPRDAKGRGIRVLYADSVQALVAIFAEKAIGAALVQDFCPGAGVGVEVLMHHGEALAVFQHRRLKEVPPGGGVAVMAIAEPPDPRLADLSISLLRAMQWEGVAMVEYRYDHATGAAALMEVNGRFWGTTGLPVAAGMEFPLHLWRIAHGEDPAVPDSYRVGTRWRHTAGYIARAHQIVTQSYPKGLSHHSRRKELAGLFGDFSPSVKDALWKISDPLPAIAECATTLAELIKSDLKWLLRKFVPKGLLKERDVYRRLGSRAGALYLQLRFLDKLGLRFANRRRPQGPLRSVVFVCHGNIMRSAVAEALFADATRKLTGKIAAVSAGMHARAGNPAHPRALLVAQQLGVNLASHSAQPMTRELVQAADAIFVMDFENLAELLTSFPEAKPKTFMLSAYAPPPFNGREIDDPFLGDEHVTRNCFVTVKNCVDQLVSDITDSNTQPLVEQQQCSDSIRTGATVR